MTECVWGFYQFAVNIDMLEYTYLIAFCYIKMLHQKYILLMEF